MVVTMTKKEYAEFHKYLAMLIYEYNKYYYDSNVSEKSRKEIEEILVALDIVMKICIIEGGDKE